jgi:cytochrome c oxidase cbb3-type subunit III
MHKPLCVLMFAMLVAAIVHAQNPAPAAPEQGRGAGQSPASQPPPITRAPQVYSPEQVQAGEAAFVSQCGFCHGRDAQGAEGPDLTRSPLVADDVRGDKIIPLVRDGRPEKGMPAFKLSDSEMATLVAFIHDAKSKAESRAGGRRTVDVDDLLTGDADAGKTYFNGAGGCAKCHSVSGPFATVGARYEGLALVQRMLHPRAGGGAGVAPVAPDVSVTTAAGEIVSGTLAYRDEFTISLRDAEGWNRTFSLASVQVSGGEDPLRGHVEQLGRYTDRDMHNVYAYLQTLR